MKLIIKNEEEGNVVLNLIERLMNDDPDPKTNEGQLLSLLTDAQIEFEKRYLHPHSKDEKHVCCDGECNHDDCCGKIEANCPIKSSCNHVMVDIGKYERECKFCKLTELRAS